MKTKANKTSHHTILFGTVMGAIVIAVLLFFSGKTALRTWNRIGLFITPTPTINPYQDPSLYERPAFLPTPVQTDTPPTLKIPVIMYHYVENIKDKRDSTRVRLNTTPYDFEQQLKELKESGYDSYFAKDIPALLSSGMYYSPHSVILTFDDGYEDFYTTVFPLLKKYHMRATAYIIYDFIGRNGFMNKEQISELLKSGLVEIGSHTLDHPYLKTTQDKEAKRQILESKRLMEAEFGMTIESFAYPFGAMSPEAIEYVKEAKYSNAVSVINGVEQSQDNVLFLSRIRPGMFSGRSAALVLEGLKK